MQLKIGKLDTDLRVAIMLIQNKHSSTYAHIVSDCMVLITNINTEIEACVSKSNQTAD